MAFVIRELLDAGLLHARRRLRRTAATCASRRREPLLDDGELVWRDGAGQVAATPTSCAPSPTPFDSRGRPALPAGQSRPRGDQDLGGRSPSTAASRPRRACSTSQDALLAAFKAGELDRDFVVVVRVSRGPRANGMPELHNLTPALGVLQDRGQRSPWSPTAACPAPRARCRPPSTSRPKPPMQAPASREAARRRHHPHRWRGRPMEALVRCRYLGRARGVRPDAGGPHHVGLGRELFAMMRKQVGSAEQGACALFWTRTRARHDRDDARADRRHRRHQCALRADRPVVADGRVAGDAKSLPNADFASLQHAMEHYLSRRERDTPRAPRSRSPARSATTRSA